MTGRALRAATFRARTAGLVLCLVVVGCTPTGDFGRPAPSVVNDALLPLAGRAAARKRGEPVSGYRLTDRERLMRDLAWAIVMPQIEEQRHDRMLTELRRTRILPAERARIDKESYVETLIGVDFRSSGARYARLQADIEADVTRVEPFFQTATQVAEDDRVRARAADRVPEVTSEERQNVDARIEENRLLVAWVRQSFDERIVTYRYALDRLVLETPDRAAVSVEASLSVLERVLASLRPLAPAGVFKS